MRGSRALALLASRACLVVALSAAAAACGRPDRSTEELIERLESSDPEAVRAAVEALGEKGREDPEVVAALIERLRRRMGEGQDVVIDVRSSLADVADPKERRDESDRLGHAIRERVAVLDLAASSVDIGLRGDDAVVRVRFLRPAEHAEEVTRRVLEHVTRPGGVQVLGVVPAPAADGGEARWPGDAPSYEAYLREEAARREAATKEGRPYEPGRKGFPVLAARGSPGPDRVLREPPPEALLDERNLVVEIAEPPGAPPGVRLTVEGPAEAEFLRWAKGREVALAVDDVVEGTVKVGAFHRGPLVVPLFGEPPEAARRARELVRWIPTGRLPRRVSAAVVPPAPDASDFPIVRALVEVGRPALPALGELEDEGGPMGAAALEIREEILRRASRHTSR